MGLLHQVFRLGSDLAYLVGHLERLFDPVLSLCLVAFDVVASDEVFMEVVRPGKNRAARKWPTN